MFFYLQWNGYRCFTIINRESVYCSKETLTNSNDLFTVLIIYLPTPLSLSLSLSVSLSVCLSVSLSLSVLFSVVYTFRNCFTVIDYLVTTLLKTGRIH